MTSLDRSATGKPFHATGPLTAKLPSPYRVSACAEQTAGTRWLIADDDRLRCSYMTRSLLSAVGRNSTMARARVRCPAYRIFRSATRTHTHSSWSAAPATNSARSRTPIHGGHSDAMKTNGRGSPYSIIAKFHYTDTDTDTDFFVAKLRWVRAGPFRRKKVRLRVRVRVGPVSVSV